METEALLVGSMMAVFAHISMTLVATVAPLGTVVVFAAVFVINGILGALAVLLLVAIALLVAVGLFSMVGIMMVVVSVRAILVGIMVTALVSKAVFAVGAMSVMTIA